jgi:glycosyltransferase involved in cell wall biosynthesis
LCVKVLDAGDVALGTDRAKERPVRLLQLVHCYPPALGGVEVAVRDMCEQLVADHGFEVTVLTSNARTVLNFKDPSLPALDAPRDELQGGVRVLRFPVRARRSRLLRQPQRVAYHLRLPGNDRLRTWFQGPISPEMRAAARGLDADVICAAAFPLNHVRYAFRPHGQRPPVVLLPSLHTADHWGFERPNLLRLVNRAYATVARTEHERDWLVARGASPERIRVIGHGIEPGELRPRADAFRMRHAIAGDGYLVAYVGQHAPHKGIDVLLAAMPRLLERCPNAWLAIGGSRTPHTVELERAFEQLPAEVRQRCRLICDLDSQEKADLLGDCDAFASPSGKEAFGITTLEAWSLRKPVVVGDSPSQACIVSNGVDGLIVPYGDERRLTEALACLGSDPSLRDALGTAGYASLLARFRRQDVERQHAELLAEAARSHTAAKAFSASPSLPKKRK